MASISVQPSWGRRSPANWGRVATLLQFPNRRLLSLVVGAFLGYFYCVAPNATATSGIWDFNLLFELMGFFTSGKKGWPPTLRILLLGADVSLTPNQVCATARSERAEKLEGRIAREISLGFLTPGAARRLRRMLRFLQFALIGTSRSGNDGAVGSTKIQPTVFGTHKRTTGDPSMAA